MPQFDNALNTSFTGFIYGAEYEYIGSHHNHDVPCSVCRALQSTTIMVPATRTCPPGWTAQYTGHLTSQYKDHFATEYLCLDGSPEDTDYSRTRDDNGFLFYYVTAQCGSLPCPPTSRERSSRALSVLSSTCTKSGPGLARTRRHYARDAAKVSPNINKQINVTLARDKLKKEKNLIKMFSVFLLV